MLIKRDYKEMCYWKIMYFENRSDEEKIQKKENPKEKDKLKNEITHLFYYLCYSVTLFFNNNIHILISRFHF